MEDIRSENNSNVVRDHWANDETHENSEILKDLEEQKKEKKVASTNLVLKSKQKVVMAKINEEVSKESRTKVSKESVKVGDVESKDKSVKPIFELSSNPPDIPEKSKPKKFPLFSFQKDDIPLTPSKTKVFLDILDTKKEEILPANKVIKILKESKAKEEEKSEIC